MLQKDKHYILKIVTFQNYWIMRENGIGKIKLAVCTFYCFDYLKQEYSSTY